MFSNPRQYQVKIQQTAGIQQLAEPLRRRAGLPPSVTATLMTFHLASRNSRNASPPTMHSSSGCGEKINAFGALAGTLGCRGNFRRPAQRQLFSALEKPGVFRNKFSKGFVPRFIRDSSIPLVTAKKQSQTVHHHDDGAAFVADHADRQWNFAQHRKRHQHNDRAERNDKILPDDAPRALAQPKRSEKIFQPVVHQHHVRLLKRRVRPARAHRHADARGGQTWRSD